MRATPATNPHDYAFDFGLQDKDQAIVAGKRVDGVFVFDFNVSVKKGPDGAPVFTGPYASGPADDRFVYLSWKRRNGEYINRVKARLSSITWKQIDQAVAHDRPLVADMTGWMPGDTRKFVTWTLG